MRDFTKSSFSFTWSMSLFGLQQLGNLLRPGDRGGPWHRVTDAFDRVTRATEGQLGDTLRETFKAGDRLQRGMVDMMFRMLGGPAMTSANWTQGMTGGCGPCRQSRPRDAAATAWQQAPTAPTDHARSPGPEVAPAGWHAEPAGWGPMPDTEAGSPAGPDVERYAGGQP